MLPRRFASAKAAFVRSEISRRSSCASAVARVSVPEGVVTSRKKKTGGRGRIFVPWPMESAPRLLKLIHAIVVARAALRFDRVFLVIGLNDQRLNWSVCAARARERSSRSTNFISSRKTVWNGLRMPITRCDARRKMSQNRNAADRAGVIDGLPRSDRPEDHIMAALIPTG